MKRMLSIILLLLPVTTFCQTETEEKPFETWSIKGCQEYVISELIKAENGKMKDAAKGRVTNTTKTIYITKQAWLQDLPDTINGVSIKYVDIDDDATTIAKDVKANDAAVYYISPLEMKVGMGEMWLFPIDVTKGMGKAKINYSSTAYKIKYFFNYDPPKYEYRGVDTIEL